MNRLEMYAVKLTQDEPIRLTPEETMKAVGQPYSALDYSGVGIDWLGRGIVLFKPSEFRYLPNGYAVVVKERPPEYYDLHLDTKKAVFGKLSE